MNCDAAVPENELSGVAIIGMAGRFPGASDVNALWDMLIKGEVPLHEISDEELEHAPASALLTHPEYVRKRFVLDDIDQFDARFFGYSPNEAMQLDPQQRLFLQTAWHAMEHGGYTATKTQAKIGVFASANFNTYAPLNPQWPNLGQPEPYMDRVLASDKDYLASRCAYKFDLHGPAITIQTACSSSLTAVIQASNELLTYGSDLALAGGAAVSARQFTGYLWREDSPLARQGLCLPFDARATGMIDSSGVAVVLLKRLSDALRDGDTIYAVIAGTGMSNDGARKSSFTAPGVDGQVEAIRGALEMAGIQGDAVSYVETHGTGTPMGDPVEVAALSQALGQQGQPCILGALKANIGHMGAAAGIGGLIKAALAMHHQIIPPHPTFLQANPECRLDQGRFQINQQPFAWTGGKRYAGVSSFGLGGGNAHVILTPAPVVPPSAERQQEVLIGLSALNESSLEQARHALLQVLARPNSPPLADVAYTLAVGRKDFALRIAAQGQDRASLIQALQQAKAHQVKPLKTVWLFPGAGTQSLGMGRFLYQHNSRFQRHIDQICAQAIALGIDDPRQLIRAEECQNVSTTASLVTLFAVELALAYELQYLGVSADAMLGHSFGEYAVACLAGVFDITTAIAIIQKRTGLIEQTRAGGMLVIPAAAWSQHRLADFSVELAAVNGSHQVMISGSREAIDQVQAHLAAVKVTSVRVPVAYAGHSSLLDPILPAFAEFLQGCQRHPAQRDFISSASGDWIDRQQVASVEYWVTHLRDTVQFCRGIETLFQQGATLFIEVGPGRSLETMVRQYRAIPSDSQLLATQGGNNEAVWRKLLADIWRYGCAETLPQRLLGQGAYRRIPLPGYAFNCQRYWQEASSSQQVVAEDGLQVRPCEEWLVYPVWTQYPLDNHTGQSGQYHWLWGANTAFNSQLAQRLEASGAIVQQTADVPVITTNTRVDHIWFLLPLQVARPEPEQAALDYFQSVALPLFNDLLALVRQLAVYFPDKLPAITLAGHGLSQLWRHEIPIAELSILASLLRTLPHEISGSVCRCVDIEQSADNVDNDASIEQLLMLVSAPAPETPLDQTFAIRQNMLWRKEYREATALQDLSSPAIQPRPGGCYLVLGGSGGIGWSLARALLPAAAQISLLGVRELTGERLQRYEALRQQGQSVGCEINWFQADLADASALQQAFSQAVERMGNLHGVIHAAGVVGGGLIQAELPKGAQSNLGPKIAGLLTLDPLLRHYDLDFVLLCSSLGAHTGATGQLDNVMGNSFFDSYACTGRLPRCRQLLSVGWDYWREVGMINKLEVRHKALTGEAIHHGMTPEQGAAWFLRLLGTSHSPVLITTLRFAQIRAGITHRAGQFINKLAALPCQVSEKRPRALDTPLVLPCGVLERLICHLWAEQLGLEQVGSTDNYLDLGGDSLRALSLLGTLQEALETEISIRALYQHPTPAGLASWLLSSHDQKTLLTRAECYLEICAMSDDEVSQALNLSSRGDTSC